MEESYGEVWGLRSICRKNATREGLRRSIEDREIQAANEADERGKEILVEALLEVKQDDDTIIRMLHKYYGLNEDDAEQLIVGERTIYIPCKTLETYLVRTEGFSRDEAYHYIVDSGIIDKLRENRTRWKKSAKDLFTESKKH